MKNEIADFVAQGNSLSTPAGEEIIQEASYRVIRKAARNPRVMRQFSLMAEDSTNAPVVSKVINAIHPK